EGRECLRICGDISDPGFCQSCVQEALDKFGKIDVLVNNAGEQHVSENLEDISPEQLQKTFSTNVFGAFYLTQATLPHLKKARVHYQYGLDYRLSRTARSNGLCLDKRRFGGVDALPVRQSGEEGHSGQ